MGISSLHFLPALAGGEERERQINVLRNDTVKVVRLYNVCDHISKHEYGVFVERYNSDSRISRCGQDYSCFYREFSVRYPTGVYV
jgi:hypothetical protein